MAVTDTRKAIAEAAAQEFLLRGYAGASLSAIAERLGLTKGALSYHFRAKSDFSEYFLQLVRAATAQANAYAKTEYPECGARRLVLYFMVMGAWRATEPRYAAGMTLFTDIASPAFEAAEVIQDWLELSADALETARDSGSALSTPEAAEVFLVMNLGAVFFSRHMRAGTPRTRELRFVRAGLTAAGISQADRYADDVLERYENTLPKLDYSTVDAG